MPDVPVVRLPLTRTAVIAAAIRAQLDERRLVLDAAMDLGEIQITVRLEAGTNIIRTVNFSEERIVRRR